MTERTKYLIALFAAERERSPPVQPGYVAETLDRSPAATTEMLQRLEERGLVDRNPYEGATLTEEGRAVAADQYHAYRTLARFFRDVLELEDPGEEAMEVAGTVSPTVAEQLASILPRDGDGEPPEPIPETPLSPSDGER